MDQALPWLTFAAALIAAIGTFVGPIIAYRASIRTIQGQQQLQSERQRQETLERLIEQAAGDNAPLSSYAMDQLDYLLSAGKLSIEQTTAARNAIKAVLDRLEPTVGNLAQVEEDGVRRRAVEGGQP